MVKKKQRGKGKHAGQVRTVHKREELDSFFKWFEPPDMPPMESMDEDGAEELEEIFEEDFDLAMAFRTQIIPKAVLWFTGEVC
jgi:nucleosome assembly protein 1-like 1